MPPNNNKNILLNGEEGGEEVTYLSKDDGTSAKSESSFRKKEFVLQNSVLTDLFQYSKHFQAIEHFVICAILFWALATIVSDYFDGKAYDLGLLVKAFANYPTGAFVWAKLMLMTFGFFFLAKFWALNRPTSVSINNNSFDRFFLIVYFFYQAFFSSVTWNVLFKEPILGPATATALSVEQIRLIAKMHSFIRENHERILNAEEKLSKFPSFSRYLYFLFAPTLIYRDAYPQTQAVKWRRVFCHFAQFIGCFVANYCIFDRYVMPEFDSYSTNKAEITVQMMAKSAFRGVLPTVTIFLLFFYGFFHSWLNVWAELLRFGDRLFYKDWWNSYSFCEFYRSWNCTVHDWLYAYVYKDSHALLNIDEKTKVCSTLLVFAISSAFHEFVTIAMFGMFFPLMTLNLIGGFLLTFVKSSNKNSRIYNFAFWLIIFYGYGTMFYLYLFETSARRLCPHCPVNNSFVPRFLSCFNNKPIL